MKKLLKQIGLVLVATFLTIEPVLAVATAIPKPDSLPGPAAAKDPGTLREWFINTLLPGWTVGLISFVGAVALLMLIVSGIRYLTAYGDEGAQSAKKMITYSIIGVLLALFSYAIVSIIANLQI